MKKTTKILALLLALIMCVSMFAACSGDGEDEETKETASDATDKPAEERVQDDKTLVVGYSPFSEKFSPFFAETAYDQDVAAMTQVSLLPSDREGAIVFKGIEGETRSYNGTDYTYNGIADLEMTENEDGTVTYDFTLRDDVKFADGEILNADDVIFSMYVLCDPMYDGSSTLFAQPIEGMEEYRNGMGSFLSFLVAAGRDNDDFENWDEDTQKAFWADLDKAGEAFAQEIVDFCKAEGYNAEDDSVAACAANWGFELEEDATAADFFDAMFEAYEGDLKTLSDTETAGSSLFDLMENYDEYSKVVTIGEPAANISGIQKIDDTHVRVVMTKVDATAIYQLSLSVAPLHYYGDEALFDYDNNKFGFEKGNLDLIRAKTTKPMGAGPYNFIKYENGVVNFEANDYYFLGKPLTKYVNFQETLTDDDKLNGVVTGTIDITDPSFGTDQVEAIKAANGGELNGDKIVVNAVDNLGYGYIGMNAKRLSVNGDPASDASKNLRKAFGTIFSVYRDISIDSYYGERASVINYPISNTSWAAPRVTDDGYCVAFSKDVDGNDIYTSEMTDEEKYDAALKASLGFFEAAGYKVKDGKITEAPKGASLEYELQIPADGSGDHPAFMIVTDASDALKTIGINLIVTDLSNSADLWTSLEANTCDMWAAAWGATVDPDMYQIYFSGNDTMSAGGSNYMYSIADEELNEYILEARETTDQDARKAMYKDCLDIIIDWAVEIPVYQRQNAIIFSTERVNLETITPDITTFYGWMSEIQNTRVN